jgi:hypothetical protein
LELADARSFLPALRRRANGYLGMTFSEVPPEKQFETIVSMLREFSVDLTQADTVTAFLAPDKSCAILVAMTPEYPGGFGLIVTPETLEKMARGPWS